MFATKARTCGSTALEAIFPIRSLVVDFAQTEHLNGEDLAEIDLAFSDADTPAACNADGSVVNGIRRISGRHIDARRRCIEVAGTSPAERLVRTLSVVNLDEAIKALLLLKKIEGRRLCGCLLQGEMHPFMPTVLLRATATGQLCGPLPRNERSAARCGKAPPIVR